MGEETAITNLGTSRGWTDYSSAADQARPGIRDYKTFHDPETFRFASDLQSLLKAELLIAAACRAGGRCSRGRDRQAGRPGRPVVAPQIGGQLSVNGQLAQMAEAELLPARRRAVAATAAARAMAHHNGHPEAEP